MSCACAEGAKQLERERCARLVELAIKRAQRVIDRLVLDAEFDRALAHAHEADQMRRVARAIRGEP